MMFLRVNQLTCFDQYPLMCHHKLQAKENERLLIRCANDRVHWAIKWVYKQRTIDPHIGSGWQFLISTFGVTE